MLVGSGAYAQVRARSEESCSVLKIYNDNAGNDKDMRESEAAFFEYDTCVSGSAAIAPVLYRCLRAAETVACLEMERYDCDLAQWVQTHDLTKLQNEAIYLSILIDVFCIVLQLRSLGVNHNDLYFRNVVLQKRRTIETVLVCHAHGYAQVTRDYNVRFIDFGLVSSDVLDCLGRRNASLYARFSQGGGGRGGSLLHPIYSALRTKRCVDLACLAQSISLATPAGSSRLRSLCCKICNWVRQERLTDLEVCIQAVDCIESMLHADAPRCIRVPSVLEDRTGSKSLKRVD